MATGKSGYFTMSGSKAGITVQANWTETYDQDANTSNVGVSLYVKSSSYYGYSYYLSGTVKVNGTTVKTFSSSSGGYYVTISALNTYYSVKASTGYSSQPWYLNNIAHNTDGTKSVTISVTLSGYTSSGSGGSGWTASGSSTVTLTDIPRASTIGATDANIGSVSTVTVSRKSTSYNHSIAYAFGTLSGYLTAAGGVSQAEVIMSGTSIPWTVPTSFYSVIPNAMSGTCTLTITTYNASGGQVGDAQTCSFQASVPATSAPVVSGTVVDTNSTTVALTGNSATLVKYFSTARGTITATAQNSATIATKSIAGVTVSGTTYSIPNVEVNTFGFLATDSRGLSGSSSVTSNMVEYVKLTNNAAIARTDPTSGRATLVLSGDVFRGSFGAASNTLRVRYRYKVAGGSFGSYVTASVSFSGNSYSASLSLTGLTYTSSFVFEVEATDSLMTVTATLTLNKGIPVCDWGDDDFVFHVPVTFEDEVSGIPDASVSQRGLAQLLDSVTSSATNLAATPSAVKTAYDLANSKAKPAELLWTNASPTSNFAAQSITVKDSNGNAIDLSQYAFLEVAFLYQKTMTDIGVFRVPVNYANYTSCPVVSWESSSYPLEIGLRFVKVADAANGVIYFTTGYCIWTTSSSSSRGTYANYAIPYQIWGVQ